MAGDADKEYTAGGNMRAPARHILVAWMLKAWNKLETERVNNTLKDGGVTRLFYSGLQPRILFN